MNEQFGHVVDYIRQSLYRGTPEEQVRQTLLQQNWSAELVDNAIEVAKATYAPIQSATPQEQATTTPAKTRKYKVFQALGDAFEAIKNNADVFFRAVILSHALSFILLMSASSLSLLLFGWLGLLQNSSSSIIVLLFQSIFISGVLSAVTGAFILITTSLALNDGSEGQKSSLKTVLTRCRPLIKRVTLANLLYGLITFGPLVLAISSPLILMAIFPNSGFTYLLLVPVFMVVGIIWTCLLLLRFALVPYVALFEPMVPITKTLGRSKQLLKNGGKWFLVKGTLVLIIVFAIVAITTGYFSGDVPLGNRIIANVLIAVISVVVNSVLVMLYRIRSMVHQKVA